MSVFLRVAELNAAYARTIDADKLEAWPDFFVSDCLYKITSAENHKRGYLAGIIYADSRAMLQDRVTALRTANTYERQSYRHIIGLPVIGASGSDGITAETSFLVARITRGGQLICSQPGCISISFATRPANCVSSNVSWCATAASSTRCLPFPCRGALRSYTAALACAEIE